MAATPRRAAAVVAAFLLTLLAASARADSNGVYEPCADATVQRGDGFTFGVAFAARDAFSSGGVQLSPCDTRLNLPGVRAQVALFRPTVDEISLLTVNASDPNALVSCHARDLPDFVFNWNFCARWSSMACDEP
jgi:hypothetical protein